MTNEQFQQFMDRIGHVFNEYGTGEALVFVRDEKDKRLWLVQVANDGNRSEGFAMVGAFLIQNLKEMENFALYEKVEITK